MYTNLLKSTCLTVATSCWLLLGLQTPKALADSQDTTQVIQHFDWREVHGANDPASDYYDGDSQGSGWMTSVDEQSCSHCWAFSSVHATEAIINLYYNQHLDRDPTVALDLSEQEVASCSGGNSSYSCENGGFVYRTDGGSALSYLIEDGVSEEACFPYEQGFPLCDQKCDDPDETFKISGITAIPTTSYDEIKQAIIQYGPLVGCVRAEFIMGVFPEVDEVLGHCVVVMGFDQDPVTGQTLWIYKNSFGENYDELIDYGPGYGALPVPLTAVSDLYALNTPIISAAEHEIACNDFDGDGYANWGISEQKPDTCDADVPSVPDCDDSSSAYVFRNDNGHCLRSCSTEEDCDDDDPCTTDTCAALGCEHARITGCGECLSIEGTLDSLVQSGHAVKEDGTFKDCSSCGFWCWSYCATYHNQRYLATGSSELLGYEGSIVVALTSVEHSFIWSTDECSPSDPCDTMQCDDGDVCNGAETCVNGQCQAGVPLTCDDGAFCNGTEYCDPDYGCQSGTNPCASDETCDETIDECVASTCLDPGSLCWSNDSCCSKVCSGIWLKRCQ